MKKTNVFPLAEVKAGDVQNLNDYLEQALSLVTADVLTMSSGVIVGLNVVQNTNAHVTVGSGAIFQNRLFGELENSGSGFVINLPVSGTKTDAIVASYQEVYDTPSTGYVLMDTVTRLETVQNFNTRKFGAVKLEYVENTTAGVAPSGKIIVCEIVSASSGIVTVSTTNRTKVILTGLNGSNIQVSGTDTTFISTAITNATPKTGNPNLTYNTASRLTGISNGTVNSTISRGSRGLISTVTDGTSTLTINRDASGKITSITES
jgi:hypothetical protein